MKQDLFQFHTPDAAELRSPYYRSLLLEADPSPDSLAAYPANSIIRALTNLEGLPVALLVAGPMKHGMEILNLSVHPDFRRQGLAGRLVEEFLRGRKESVRVCTGSTSFPALALYQKCDFRIQGIDPDYFLRNYDSPIYEAGIQLRDRLILQWIPS
ncbi:MAG: GNAT family N-acetyltransferase [Leptospiraceae bacterium]|nr:GNAT family N-acetyltransferase [Leptospiraceae bacterium]